MITDIDYADDLALTSDTIEEANQLLHYLEVAAKEIGLHINAKKTEFISFNQTGQVRSLDGENIKSVEDFTYLGPELYLLTVTSKYVKLKLGLH